MSNRARAMELLEQVPEEKLYYIISVMEGALKSEYDMDEEIDKSIEQSEKEISEGAKLIDIEEAFAGLEAKFFG